MQLNTKRLLCILGALEAFDLAIGTGQLKITEHMIPAAIIPAVQDWAAFFAFVVSIGMTAITGGSWATDTSGAEPAAPAKPIAAAGVAGAAIIALGLVLAIGGDRARAADLPGLLPVKAFQAPRSPCLPTNCSGFYAGVNLSGVMTNANVIGNGINGSIAAGGQSIGLQAGYQFANGAWFFGPEFQANYIVGGNPNVTGEAPAKYRVAEYLKVGMSLATLLNMPAPSIGSPGIPAALANALISQYLIVGAVQTGIGQGWATGAGVEFALAANWFLDTRYTYINYGSANVSPTEVAKSENLVTVGFNYKF